MRGRQLEQGLMIGKEYSISFQLEAWTFSPGFSNVLQFTTGAHHAKLGSRVPAVWLHKTAENELASLYICADVNNNVDYCHHTKPILDTWTEIKVQVKQTRILGYKDYKYQILISGELGEYGDYSELKHEIINKSPRTFHNVKLFVSNEIDTPVDGNIKYIEYTGGL